MLPWWHNYPLTRHFLYASHSLSIIPVHPRQIYVAVEHVMCLAMLDRLDHWTIGSLIYDSHQNFQTQLYTWSKEKGTRLYFRRLKSYVKERWDRRAELITSIFPRDTILIKKPRGSLLHNIPSQNITFYSVKYPDHLIFVNGWF